MGKSLRADIIIGGKADNSFFELGNQLQNIGKIVNVASGKLIQFGKESVKAYTNYEDAMLDAQVALRTQYESSSELSRVMDHLTKSSMEWASGSRFTTEDVAGAIANAAHAGWDLEQILNGVPQAMDISLAGGMNLAEGLEYLVDISNAAGLNFGELGTLVDDWAYAANRSSTTIPEMGAAMQKMGATMQFVKGDMAGLTTMLAVLADNGAKGTEAGTLLRNSMIRLIAPTKAAAESMGSLYLSAEDLDEIYTNQAQLDEVSKMLSDVGFSAYDANGDLKSFLTIFQELNKATEGMTEQDRNKILSSIFPTRTITGALALLDAAANSWDGLYGSITENASGYADYAAQTMESGLGGTLRHLSSVYNTLQTRTGSELADPVGNIANRLSGLIDSVNGMDDASFSAMVKGLETIAGAGPLLLTAGGGLKIIGKMIAKPEQAMWTALGLGAVGITALAHGLNDLSNSAYEAEFGNLVLGTEQISGYISTLGSSFEQAQKSIEAYNEGMETAIQDYITASSTMKEGMLTTMLSGGKLSSADINNMHALGNQMRNALIEGINESYSGAEDVINFLGDGESGLTASLLDTLNYGYSEAIARARQLSADLRNAMTSAFSDGALSADEISNIQNIINQQNELLAMQTDAKNATARARMMQQAQTLGIDQTQEIAALVTSTRDAELAALEDNYWQSYELLTQGGMAKIKQGAKNADGTLYTQSDLDAELAGLYQGYVGKRNAASANFDQELLNLFGSTIMSSEAGAAWQALSTLAGDNLANGYFDEAAYDAYTSSYSLRDRNTASKYLDSVIEAFGGYNGMLDKIGYYNQIGNSDMANQFSQMLGMYGTANGSDPMVIADVKANTDPAKQAVDAAVEYANSQTATFTVNAEVNGLPTTGNPSGMSPIEKFHMYAEGGRATEPGIFGDAGPEWAIPEEHTAKTADLLNAARQASGFSWQELIARNGGLNAGGGSSSTFVYSPTINAGNADGVADVLDKDKNRMEKWFREKAMRSRVEEYS